MSFEVFEASDFPHALSVSVKKGSCIVYEGEQSCNIAYLITSGSMEVITECIDGTQTSIYKLKPGEIFGELAMMGISTRTASVYAIEDSTLLKITAAVWQKCLEDPEFLMRVNHMLVHRYLETTKVVRRLGQSSVLHRLGIYLLTLPEWNATKADEITLTLPSHAQLARLLNCTRERVSKVMRELYRAETLSKHKQNNAVTISKTKLTDTLMDIGVEK
jgi:CRP-like cAMP-binding protein